MFGAIRQATEYFEWTQEFFWMVKYTSECIYLYWKVYNWNDPEYFNGCVMVLDAVDRTSLFDHILRNKMGIIVWWFVSRSVPCIVIKNSYQHISVMMGKVKHYRNRGEIVSCAAYMRAWPR